MKCSICNENDERCIQIHHKDENHKNNSIDNLAIVCANCHFKIHNWSNGSNVKKLIKRIEANARDGYGESKYKWKKKQKALAEQAIIDEIEL